MEMNNRYYCLKASIYWLLSNNCSLYLFLENLISRQGQKDKLH